LHHAISEGHGDAAIQLLKAGADPEKRDSNGKLAIELAPDSKVGNLLLMAATSNQYYRELTRRMMQVRKYIIQTAEREGIDLP
jgi:26S proteasome non-ATPase regulatory subunit 10